MRCLFSREVEAFSQNSDGVTLNLKGSDGERETVRADWLVACDGGASFIRRALNIPFEGKTAPNQWIVIDIANDPLATPHVYLCCDPVRPYVSAALPHGYGVSNLWSCPEKPKPSSASRTRCASY